MEQTKLKISQKEIDEIYEIADGEGITEETQANSDKNINAPPENTNTEDTTPSVLTEQEQEYEDEYLDRYSGEEI